VLASQHFGVTKSRAGNKSRNRSLKQLLKAVNDGAVALWIVEFLGFVHHSLGEHGVSEAGPVTETQRLFFQNKL
jgi:hypothetical protein